MKHRNLRRYVKPHKKAFARKMRANPTRHEAAVWERIRDRKLGVKFRRQAIIRGWIVDFWCPELGLVVELDGEVHLSDEQRLNDCYRDACMMEIGIRVVRFDNSEVDEDLDAVIDQLLYIIRQQQEAA